MRCRPRLSLNQKGFTLIELMMVTLLIAIITPAITYLFAKVQQGMGADEMHGQLQKLNETTLTRLYERLSGNRRFFQNDGSGVSFLGRVAFSASAPSTLLNSQLSLAQATTTGSLSPATSINTSFGNAMLFAAYDSPSTISGKPYNSPLTIKGAGVTYGSGGPATLVIDVYRFYYFYLTPKNPMSLKEIPTYGLVEWRSAQYADYYELNDIVDSTLQAAAISWLAVPGNATPGNPGYGVTLAWDHSQRDPNLAFYTLATTGAFTLVPAQTILEGTWTYLTHVSSGILSSGFKYGICGNTTDSTYGPTGVPLYARANSPYPGGFEVGLSGTSGTGKEVLFRSLLVAKGVAPKVVNNDETSLINIRDVW